MAIDPMHLPIFGDPRPVQPPAPVRAAAVLLLVQAAVTAATVVHSDADPTFFTISVLLTLAFAYGLRGGRDWARVAASLSAFVSLFLSVGLVGGLVELALVTASAVLLAWSVRLLFRADVHAFFTSADPDSR